MSNRQPIGQEMLDAFAAAKRAHEAAKKAEAGARVLADMSREAKKESKGVLGGAITIINTAHVDAMWEGKNSATEAWEAAENAWAAAKKIVGMHLSDGREVLKLAEVAHNAKAAMEAAKLGEKVVRLAIKHAQSEDN